MRTSFFLRLVLLSALPAFCLPAFADDVPQVDRSEQQASVLAEKIRRETREQDTPLKPAVIEQEEQAPAAPVSGPQFLVKKLRIEGDQVIPEADIRPLIEAFEGKMQTLSTMEALAQKITDEYRKKGFITSLAYVPEQKIINGEAVIRVVEGKIGQIEVEGNRYFRKKRIRSYLGLKSGQPLHYRTLRSGVDRINRHRDREVRSILRRGVKPETTDIILKTKDHLPLHASALFDNQGSRASGQKRYGLTLQDNNLTGLDDSLLTGTVFGQRFGAFFTRYELPLLPRYGTTLTGAFSHVQVAPKKELTDFGVNGIARTYTAGIRQPLVHNNRLDLDTELNFDAKESRTKVLSGTFRRERLRVLRPSHQAALRDPWGETRWEQTYAFGLRGLGAAIFADPSSSRQDVKPGFFRMYGNVLRRVKMPYKTSLMGKLNYQVTTDRLASSEGLYMGGGSTIRGYPEGDYIADNGVYYTFEYQVPAFFVPAEINLPFTKRVLKDQVDLVTFIDDGFGKVRDPANGEVKERHLTGVGGGIRVRLFQNIYSRLEWAQAVGDHPLTDTGRGEFHFRVQAEV